MTPNHVAIRGTAAVLSGQRVGSHGLGRTVLQTHLASSLQRIDSSGVRRHQVLTGGVAFQAAGFAGRAWIFLLGRFDEGGGLLDVRARVLHVRLRLLRLLLLEDC
uniref:(northern house mosquito) hypothetical protein n=1 Tax=Culex pipiens TaxID=7175 RepID=A0A8D8HUK1_CULPI